MSTKQMQRRRSGRSSRSAEHQANGDGAMTISGSTSPSCHFGKNNRLRIGSPYFPELTLPQAAVDLDDPLIIALSTIPVCPPIAQPVEEDEALPADGQANGTGEAKAGFAGAREELTDQAQGDVLAIAVSPLLSKHVEETLGTKIRFIDHEIFNSGSPADVDKIMAPTPGRGCRAYKTKPPPGLPPYLAGLYTVPLLDSDQEVHLFRKMNYLRSQQSRCQSELQRIWHQGPRYADRPRHWCLRLQGLCREFDRLRAQAQSISQEIATANLRLVVSRAKKFLNMFNGDLMEAIAAGNLTLVVAVNGFDFSRGNKFSTYAQWAIDNGYKRPTADEWFWRSVQKGDCPLIEIAPGRGDHEATEERAQAEKKEVLRRLLEPLDDRERKVLTDRFGLGGTTELTLEQLGRELGITKERVRQIEARALEKLRKICERKHIDLQSLVFG